MAQRTSPLLPGSEQLLQRLGERLRMARLRRRLPAKQLAERAGMSPMTLRSLERGGSGVTIGAYVAVMQVLGVESDLDLLAQADSIGRQLQDAQLRTRARPAPAKRPRSEESKQRAKPAKAQPEAASWQQDSEFINTDQLAKLLDAPTRSRAVQAPQKRHQRGKP